MQDLEAHIHGGIPERDIEALKSYWDAFPQLRTALFKLNRPSYEDLATVPSQVQQAILSSTEFEEFTDRVRTLAESWFEDHRSALETIKDDTRPNDLIADLGDDLLARFKPTALLDEYDVYEQLMTYWHDTMHDDVFLIMNDGWVGASKPRAARIIDTDTKGKPKYEDANIVLGTPRKRERWVTDLVPPELVIARYFANECAHLDDLKGAAEAAGSELSSYIEENNAEDGPIWDAITDDEKVTAASLKEALQTALAVKDDESETALRELGRLMKEESAAKKAVKDAQVALDLTTLKQYGKLTEEEVKTLVVDDKWATTIQRRIVSEVTSLTHELVSRIRELSDRYAETTAELDANFAKFESKLTLRLAAMGVK